MHLVLFDLDGTLLDTAPDLSAALNAQRAEYKLAPLPPELIRQEISHGSSAMLKLAFGVEPDDSRYAGMRERLWELYRERLSRETRFFPGVEAMLAKLEQLGWHWGIVTNKPATLTEPLLDAFQVRERAVCIVSGDSTPRRKPYPDGLLHACALAAADPTTTVYIGDARQDVQAAHAAGMRAVLALYGYLGVNDQPDAWGADGLLQKPGDILAWLANNARHRACLQGANA